MGDDRTDDLLKEIASKHGVALDREDPILIVQTLHARLLADSQSAQQAMLEDYRTTLESLLDRWSAETTAKAERIVTASLTATTVGYLNLLAALVTFLSAVVVYWTLRP